MFKKPKISILFVEQKNDYLSQMAEYFTNKLFPEMYEAYSAGPEHDIVDCEMISSMYQNGEDIRRQISKDFKDKSITCKGGDYDYIIYLDKSSFKEWSKKGYWRGKQILVTMKPRSEFNATDDLELHNEYVAVMNEVNLWVLENLCDPKKLDQLVSV